MHKNNHKLRVGIVGAGNIVRTRNLPALKKNPDVEIVAVSNSTYESSEKFCREYSLSALPIRHGAELVATPDIDIVWIGTTPYMHSAVTISALEAGKHVFCQARMSMDLAEANEMLAASKRCPELVTSDGVATRSDAVVLVITFLVTVAVDLITAVAVGVGHCRGARVAVGVPVGAIAAGAARPGRR